MTDFLFPLSPTGKAIKKFRPPDLPNNFQWQDQEEEAKKRAKVYSSNADLSLGDTASESGGDASENPFAKRPGYWDEDREKLPAGQQSADGPGSGVEEYQGGDAGEASEFSQPSELDLEGEYQNLDLSGIKDQADEY